MHATAWHQGEPNKEREGEPDLGLVHVGSKKRRGVTQERGISFTEDRAGRRYRHRREKRSRGPLQISFDRGPLHKEGELHSSGGTKRRKEGKAGHYTR